MGKRGRGFGARSAKDGPAGLVSLFGGPVLLAVFLTRGVRVPATLAAALLLASAYWQRRFYAATRP